jgi:hypothetical protein
MSKLKDKAQALQAPKSAPDTKVKVQEVKPAVQNPDKDQRGRSKELPGHSR